MGAWPVSGYAVSRSMGSWQVPRPGLISNYSAGEHYPGLVREAVKTIRISNVNVVCGEVWCVQCSAVLCCGSSSRFLWAKTFGVLKTFKSNKERRALSTNGLLPRVKGSLSVSGSGVSIQIRSRWQRSPRPLWSLRSSIRRK